MSGHELASELLETARSDLKALEHMLDPASFDDRVFGFHAQQAVEKALKAWLNVTGRTHPLTHDLSFLLHALEEQGADVNPWWDFVDLSGFAVSLRYQVLPEGEEPLERERLLANVRELIRQVTALLE